MRFVVAVVLGLLVSVVGVSAQSPDVVPDVVNVSVVPVTVKTLPVLGVTPDFFKMSFGVQSYDCNTLISAFDIPAPVSWSFSGLYVCPARYAVDMRVFGFIIPLVQMLSAVAGIVVFKMVRQ